MTLKSDIPPGGAGGIGTTLVAIGVPVPATLVRVLVGLRIVNGHVSQAIAPFVYLRRGGVDYPIVPGPFLRVGASMEGLGGGKLVMMAGDQLFARSTVAASMYVFPSYDEDVA